MRVKESDEIEELLDELDHNLTRLRIDYDQFFAGALRREPQALRGKVQKAVTLMMNHPPRNSAQKFRFNTLNSRFQIHRQNWGRLMREIEAGTYKPHRFRADLHDVARGVAPPPEPSPAPPPSPKGGSPLDQLYEALAGARTQTGEGMAGLDRQRLERIVKQQSDALRKQHGAGTKVTFKVAIEGGKAKLKALVKQ